MQIEVCSLDDYEGVDCDLCGRSFDQLSVLYESDDQEWWVVAEYGCTGATSVEGSREEILEALADDSNWPRLFTPADRRVVIGRVKDAVVDGAVHLTRHGKGGFEIDIARVNDTWTADLFADNLSSPGFATFDEGSKVELLKWLDDLPREAVSEHYVRSIKAEL